MQNISKRGEENARERIASKVRFVNFDAISSLYPRSDVFEFRVLLQIMPNVHFISSLAFLSGEIPSPSTRESEASGGVLKQDLLRLGARKYFRLHSSTPRDRETRHVHKFVGIKIAHPPTLPEDSFIRESELRHSYIRQRQTHFQDVVPQISELRGNPLPRSHFVLKIPGIGWRGGALRCSRKLSSKELRGGGGRETHAHKVRNYYRDPEETKGSHFTLVKNPHPRKFKLKKLCSLTN